jgi:hypothetical protein
MDNMRFYGNLAALILICAFWVLLDVIFENKSELTDVMLMAFFLVWNLNACKSK